jgi:rubrerythrin
MGDSARHKEIVAALAGQAMSPSTQGDVMRKWRCRECGYIHAGPEPPDFCPECYAPKEAFIEVFD